jgi:hypothetical protein
MHSQVSLSALIIGLIIAFALGAAWRLMSLAFADLRDTKAKVKKLRKYAWFTRVPATLRAGLVVAVVLYLTVNWVQRDQKDQGPTPLFPHRSASPTTKLPKAPKVHPYTPKTFGK